MSGRDWVCIALLAGGLLILAITGWARRGRFRAARAWMHTPLGEMRTERIVILGGPVCGFGILALGIAAIPEHAFGADVVDADLHGITTAVALAILAVLVVPLLYWILVFLPLPDVLYPTWAREIRRDRRRFPQTSPDQPQDDIRDR